MRASRGKWLRAEPVAALYEQGRGDGLQQCPRKLRLNRKRSDRSLQANLNVGVIVERQQRAPLITRATPQLGRPRANRPLASS